MRKFALILIVVIGCLMLACGYGKEPDDYFEIEGVVDVTDYDKTSYNKDNISIVGNVMYAPIGGTTVAGGGVHKFSIQEFVDLRTGVIYMAYQIPTGDRSVSISPVYNEDGTLKVYDKLEELRNKCDYMETGAIK